MMEKNTMTENDKLQMFEDRPIRTAWDETQEEWYFSVVDVVAVLTEQTDNRRAAKYWSVLKTRLKNEGSELTTNCSQLKMKAADGKRRLTDVANTEQLLRIIQSVPSKKAEPFNPSCTACFRTDSYSNVAIRRFRCLSDSGISGGVYCPIRLSKNASVGRASYSRQLSTAYQ